MKSIRAAEQAALEPYGLEIEQADSGAAGLQKALGSRWDLIFLDIEMPLMDGPTMLRLLRAKGVKTPVVLVTSVSTTAILSGAIKAGAAHYISKPFSSDQIRGAAVRLLGLDPALLDVPPPRALLLAPGPELAGELASRLPAHVLLDAAASLSHALELCEEGAPGALVIDPPADGSLHHLAGELRRAAPTAGIFALAPAGEAPPAAPGRPGARPAAGDVDGWLPRPPPEEAVHGLLYLNFLRPLVFSAGVDLRAAAFQGDPQHQLTYFVSLGRHLVPRAEAAATGRGEARLDLTLCPPDIELLAPLVLAVSGALSQKGVAGWFRLPPEVRAAVGTRPELAGVLLLD